MRRARIRRELGYPVFGEGDNPVVAALGGIRLCGEAGGKDIKEIVQTLLCGCFGWFLWTQNRLPFTVISDGMKFLGGCK